MNNDLQNIIIRQENAADYKEIDNITCRAFDKSGELVAELVNNIRKSQNYIPALSLVADKDEKIVGHIMISHLDLDYNGTLHRIVTLFSSISGSYISKKGNWVILNKNSYKKGR